MNLHHGVRHVGDVVQAPVDHERREEELEQQREAGLFGGRRQRGLERQAPLLLRKQCVARPRWRAAQAQHARSQSMDEHERLGMKPRITRVVGNQDHRVQHDQREEQRVYGERRVDPEDAELPLALQHAAVKAAQRGDDPVRKRL